MHDHLRLLKIWKASRICMSFLRKDHAILVCIARVFMYVLPLQNRITQLYTWIDQSFSLAREPLLVVALKFWSCAPSLHYHTAAWDVWSMYWLDVTWAIKQRSTPSPTYWRYAEGVSARMVTWDSWKFEMLQEFPCHPWAGPMLIFSVLFQIEYMCCGRKHDHTAPHWIDKSLSQGRHHLLVVAMNYRSFVLSLQYQNAAGDACSRSWLDVIWASKQRSTRSPIFL